MTKTIRWLTTNLRIFLLAFVLALTVWVMAVTTSDPAKSEQLPQPVAIEYIGQDPGLVLTGDIPATVEIRLQAPESIWEQVLADPTSVRAIVDLTGLAAGTHRVVVNIQVSATPVRVLSATPQALTLTLERLSMVQLPVSLGLSGDPAIGYQVDEAVLTPAEVVASGPESLVLQVASIHASLDASDARESMEANLPLTAYDASGDVLSGITLTPDQVHVSLPVHQQGGYRDLVVKVVTVGHTAGGYRLASVAAFPSLVTVYSANIALIESLPGYVETTPLDLSGASNNIEIRLGLILPTDVTLVGDQTVQVQVGIEPITDSLTIGYRPVEVIGLSPGFTAQVSPVTVDVILSGPIPSLETLRTSDIRVTVDASGLAAGVHQLVPTVRLTLSDLIVQSILPGIVQVTITGATTPIPR